ncbi:hypothetical protein [Actinophytocola gossypii]|nr:hypothetical protein [Actinophytocola gossypii]
MTTPAPDEREARTATAAPTRPATGQQPTTTSERDDHLVRGYN